jgi:hypothetical protein
MNFFDRKEEVLEIELTSYGRHLLSKGRFKPVFYAFYDDDIVYDSAYIGYSEDQKDTEDRIKETPRTKTQTSFRNTRGFITAIESIGGPGLTAGMTPGPTTIQGYFPRNYALTSELGSADYYSDKAPAYDINSLRGDISGSAMVLTSSVKVGPAFDGPKYKIPQIDMVDSTYELAYGFNAEGVSPDLLYDEDERIIYEFGDGFIEIRDDYILLEINETNTPFLRENFEVELFEISEEFPDILGLEDHNSATELTPVKMLVGTEIIRGSDPLQGLKQYAEYCLAIQVDEEIPEEILCKYKGVESTKGLFLQGSYECDTDLGSPSRLYQTEDVDIGDVCD